MKIKYVHWIAEYEGMRIEGGGELEVNKFTAGCCMEKFYEDMGDFSWAENDDGYDYDECQWSVIVEDIDGVNRWAFIKL